jgi:hypothetical protein
MAKIIDENEQTLDDLVKRARSDSQLKRIMEKGGKKVLFKKVFNQEYPIRIEDVCFAPDSNTVLILHSDGAIRSNSFDSTKAWKTIYDHVECKKIDFCPDFQQGYWLALAFKHCIGLSKLEKSRDEFIKENSTKTIELDGEFLDFAFDPIGMRMVVATTAGAYTYICDDEMPHFEKKAKLRINNILEHVSLGPSFSLYASESRFSSIYNINYEEGILASEGDAENEVGILKSISVSHFDRFYAQAWEHGVLKVFQQQLNAAGDEYDLVPVFRDKLKSQITEVEFDNVGNYLAVAEPFELTIYEIIT